MPASTEVRPGLEFQFIVSGKKSVQELRAEKKRDCGLDIHIRVKIGPISLNKDGTVLNCPIEAVDDEFLEGKGGFPVPAEGYCIYLGYYLASKT